MTYKEIGKSNIKCCYSPLRRGARRAGWLFYWQLLFITVSFASSPAGYLDGHRGANASLARLCGAKRKDVVV